MPRSILQHMRRAGLVAARRDGKFVFYRSRTMPFSICWQRFGGLPSATSPRSNSVMRRYFNDRDSLEPISRVSFAKRLARER